MKAPQILYSSAEIHARIKQTLGNPNANDRRVALVAYVSKHGESFLPHPEGLRVVCNPTAGATHPDALRSLLKRGAAVEFSDALHMKVYWSRQRGCVLTSANASASALGVSGLKEAGVWLPPGAVDIDRLLKHARPRKLTLRGLRKLDDEARRFATRHGGSYVARERAQEYLEWFKSPHRTLWKIGWYDEQLEGTAQAAKGKALAEYGCKEPYTWQCTRKGRAKPHDWLLSLYLVNHEVWFVQWMYADFVVKISPQDKKFYERDWPYHAVQVHPMSRYPTPPFRLSAQFRAALNRAALQYSFERIEKAKSDRPSAKLLRLVADEMR
jgi:hypothetical protein